MSEPEIAAVLAELDDDEPLYEHATTFERLEDWRHQAERAAAEIIRLRALLAEAPQPRVLARGVVDLDGQGMSVDHDQPDMPPGTRVAVVIEEATDGVSMDTAAWVLEQLLNDHEAVCVNPPAPQPRVLWEGTPSLLEVSLHILNSDGSQRDVHTVVESRTRVRVVIEDTEVVADDG